MDSQLPSCQAGGVSFSILAMATTSRWSWTKTQEAYVMLREWMRGFWFLFVLGCWGSWSLVTLQLQCLPWKHCLGFPLAVLLSTFPWSCLAYLRRGSTGPGQVTKTTQRLQWRKGMGRQRQIRALWKNRFCFSYLESGGGMGAWLRVFCVPHVL